MERAEKREAVTALNQVFKDTGTVVVAHYSGLTVADMTALRARMREAGGGMKVAKNRLVKLALEGTDVAHIADLFTGPTVIAFSKRSGGGGQGHCRFRQDQRQAGHSRRRDSAATNLKPDGVQALATLPSLDELRAKLVGMLQTPATRIAQVVAAPAAQVARVVGAYAEKGEAA